MAKTKKNKKNLSDATRKRKRPEGERTNPFEVKINKQKHIVLGKKTSKFEKGMPGVSRSNAIKKRKATLLQEYRKRGKAGKLTDKRIGADNPDISEADKMLKRYALEKQKTHDKTGLFNLNEEEEELTHYGQSLSEIEKFERPPSDSDDEDKIDPDIVAEEHFGGGILTKKKEDTHGPHSWKERMEELIAQTKKDRYEKQTDLEKHLRATEKLDQEWKEINKLVTQRQKKDEPAAEPPKPNAADAGDDDDYDMIFRELKFEATVVPSDRLKTEEEIAQEEKDRLDQLEADRLRRMKGLSAETKKQSTKHKSADDLDDGFVLDSDDRFYLSYKDGKILTEEDTSQTEKHSDDEGNNDAESDEVDDEDEKEDEEDDDSKDESSDEDAADPLGQTSDLESDKDDDDDDDDDNDDAEVKADSDKEKKVSESGKADAPDTQTPVEKTKDFREVLKEKKQIMEAARKELPYTFPAPETNDDLHNLLDGYSDSDQLTILERLIKCHHPSLADSNKAKLELLFGLLLEYIGDLCLKSSPSLSLVDKLITTLYQLCQTSPQSAGQTALHLIVTKQAEFNQGKKTWPDLDVLVLLKLIPVLFPTSDFKHAVVTPTMVFMSQILSQCAVKSLTDVACGLFMCGLFLEFVNQSKRYVPEAINFLHGVIFLGCPKSNTKLAPVVLPFRPVGKNIDLMILEESNEDMEVRPLKLSECHSTQQLNEKSDEFRVCAMCQCMMLAVKYGKLYEAHPAVTEIFASLLKQASELPLDRYPSALQSHYKELQSLLTEYSQKVKQPVVMQKKKPRPLRQFEPKIEQVFDGRKKRGGTKEFQEKQKLLHKYRKERKGAMREIRRDAQFIAKQKLNDQLQLDTERKRKVKEIMGQLANQEGEINTLKKLKKRL